METYFDIKDGDLVAFAGKKVYTEEEIKHSFAKALRDIRQYSELSLKTISEKTKIPLATISAYENETRIPSFITAMRLAAFFGSNLEDFLIHGLNAENEYADIFARYDFSRGNI